MKCFIITLLIAFNSIICYSQSANKEANSIVRNMANELLKVADLPGLSIAVSKKGEIIFAEGFGYADVENKIPVTISTRFRTASVAKVITATALGKLVQDGKLNLSVPIQEYVPYFPEKSFPITAMQLAGHLSGIPHYSTLDKIENRFYPTIKDALGVFSHEDLIAEPGTKYNYSSHAFTLLSAVIEGASGTNFLDYLQQQILEPLHMRNTGPDNRIQEPSPNVAKLYDWEKDIRTVIQHPADISYKRAGGGLVSTPSDLTCLAKAYSDGFLKPEIVTRMFTSQELKSGEKTQVGIGWRISQDIDGRKVIEHAGGMEGARTVVCIYPEEELVISIMVNARWTSSIEETAHMLTRPFLVNKTPKTIPEGEFKISITTKNGEGKEITGKGTFIIKKNHGKIIPETGRQFSIIYLETNNVYALISSQGIYYLTIDFDGQSLSGKAVMYGTRLLESPANDAPFLKFTSVN